jgi:hypothetical protein
VVVDPGERVALGPVSEEDPPDEVHLPQLHRARALPALVVLAATCAHARLDEAVADEER